LSTAPRLKKLTGASDAIKYIRKYKFQIANLKTVRDCAAKNDLKDVNILK